MVVRVRFAPSPTGALHIGGARTALYNWLLARQTGGTLVLRIEDTDRERSTPENVEQILDALRWLELDWDEGPLSQAERGERHRERIAELVDAGHAYEDEGAVRLRVPDEGETVVSDVIRGEVRFPHAAIDDFVIARSDGSPLYNLAVAVDDLDMGITSRDPRRGPPVEHPAPGDGAEGARRRAARVRAPAAAARPRRQEALEAPRRGVGAGAARRRLPARGGAQLHRPARLGPRRDHHLLHARDELVENFALERVSRNPAVFDEQKLRWMNGRYLRELDARMSCASVWSS